ncbi:MAG: hypothetical protein JXR81_07920 [Candidatus Goldbacteria bacterium]|nr:hypothetical protein [Candidatus Goldiibacteriota bacterium]
MEKKLVSFFNRLSARVKKGISSKAVGKNSKGQTTKFFDVYCEKQIIDFLKKNIKVKATVISEEIAEPFVINHSSRTDMHYIIIDPVDGSDNYMNSVGFVCVGIAVFDSNYEPVMSFAGNYFTGDYFYADKKKAVINGKKAGIKKTSVPVRNSALLVMSNNTFKDGQALLKFTDGFESIRSLGATIGEMLQILMGHYGVFIDVRGKLSLENFAPYFIAQKYGLLIITDPYGRPLKLKGLELVTGYDVVAAVDAGFHRKMIKGLKKVIK